jgi:chemotaxis protein histidine kinase CheA
MSSIPKSLNHDNITDEEINAYYSLRPYKGYDYDFDKQFNKILTEYIDTMAFKTPNAKRCYKKQLKKLILVERPDNSPKYRQFILWRLKQINHHKNKQKNWLMSINYNGSDKAKEMNDKLDEKDKIIKQLMEENKMLKEKLKRYENTEMKQETEEEVKEEEEEEEEEEEDIYNLKKVEPEPKPEPKPEKKTEPKKKVAEEKPVIKTKNTTEEEYKSMETDEERLDNFWDKMDEAIEECEKIFINFYKRDSININRVSDIFYTFHEDEYENLVESSETIVSDKYESMLDKALDRPFSVLKDNLNQEAK